MTELQTPRLCLHAIDTAEGERIVGRCAGAGDAWAEDFPFDGDVIGVTAFLTATAAHGDQRPFGHYRITRTADGKAIGGIGFKGQPDDGCVGVGYGLAPSARGHGYAAEALVALLNVAADHGLSRVVADTTGDNVASQRTLERAGFRQIGTNGDLYLYEVLLDAPSRGSDAVARSPVGAARSSRAIGGPSEPSVAHRQSHERLAMSRRPCTRPG